jgi:hypothetical protein
MMHINTEQAIKDIQSTIGQLTPKQNASAISRALNRGINAGRTRANKEVRTVYNITAAAFNRTVKISNATKQKHFAVMQISKAPSNLNNFKPVQTDNGVRVAVIKSEKKVIKSAFIQAIGSFVGVFARGKYTGNNFEFRTKRIRRTGPDLPIQSIKTTSPASMVENTQVYEPVRERAMEVFVNRYSHEIKKILKI